MTSATHSERGLRFGVVIAICLHATLMLGAYVGLLLWFDFPDVLREPTGVMLSKFRTNQTLVRGSYAAFTWSQVAFCIVVVAIRERFAAQSSPWLRGASSLGVIAGFAQAIGFSRWTFAVPRLAEAAQAAPQQVDLTLSSLHGFAGVGVGEHLFFCFEALWTAGLALHLLENPGPSHVSPRSARLLLVIAGAIGLYALEQLGGPFSALGPLNVPAHGALLFWLVGFALSQAVDRALNRVEVGVLGVVWGALVLPSLL